MLKNKSNLGLIIIILVGVAIAIFIATLILQPVEAPSSPASDEVDFTPFDANAIPEGATLYEVQTADSEARYIIGEILRGSPKTVIGRTNEVGGQLIVNYENLPLAEFSDFAVLAGTFQTDNSLRDGTTRDRILFADEFQLIAFTPETLIDLPESISGGDTVEFQIEGMLTIKGISQSEIFEIIATAVSDTEIDLFATTEIQREDYDLNIPNVPGVANVDEAVLIELDLRFTTVE